MNKVLVIDDSSFMRTIIKKILMNHGFEIVGEAANGRIGVEKYKELKPDIVTMDATMDEMNGLESLKEILSCDREAKVVMVSAMGQEPIVKEAMTIGAKGFLVKPFNETQLIENLSRFLQQSSFDQRLEGVGQ